MKVLVTATNYSKYCQPGKSYWKRLAVRLLKIRMEDHIRLRSLRKL